MKKLGVWRSFSRELPLQHAGQWCYHSSWWRALSWTGWGDKGRFFNDKNLEKGLRSVPVVVNGREED